MTDFETELLQARHRLEEAQARNRVKERKAGYFKITERRIRKAFCISSRNRIQRRGKRRRCGQWIDNGMPIHTDIQ